MPKSRGQPESVDVEGISVELRRFQLLVRLMRQHAGINRAEISRRTGIDETHLSKLCNPERTGRTGLSADIVRQVRIGLNISPDFFFDPQLKNVADEADLLKVYSLDEQRQKKWQASVDEQLHELSQFRLEMQAMLAMKDHEINRLKHELAQAAQNGGPRKRPPR
jgi:transcriptional regulator with XRE-family HTH domain